MKALLNITKQNWTGWSRVQPKAEELKLEVDKDSKLDFVGGIGGPDAKIKDVLEDSIVLVTNHLAPIKNAGGVSLRKDFSNLQTIIKIGEYAKFGTQTMDGGTTYTFLLEKIIN